MALCPPKCFSWSWFRRNYIWKGEINPLYWHIWETLVEISRERGKENCSGIWVWSSTGWMGWNGVGVWFGVVRYLEELSESCNWITIDMIGGCCQSHLPPPSSSQPASQPNYCAFVRAWFGRRVFQVLPGPLIIWPGSEYFLAAWVALIPWLPWQSWRGMGIPLLKASAHPLVSYSLAMNQ